MLNKRLTLLFFFSLNHSCSCPSRLIVLFCSTAISCTEGHRPTKIFLWQILFNSATYSTRLDRGREDTTRYDREIWYDLTNIMCLCLSSFQSTTLDMVVCVHNNVETPNCGTTVYLEARQWCHGGVIFYSSLDEDLGPWFKSIQRNIQRNKQR